MPTITEIKKWCLLAGGAKNLGTIQSRSCPQRGQSCCFTTTAHRRNKKAKQTVQAIENSGRSDIPSKAIWIKAR